jgi:hypothetical protein
VFPAVVVSHLRISGPFAFAGLAAVLLLAPNPSRADTTQAWCLLAQKGEAAPVPELQRCLFAQRQGNAEVTIGGRPYGFPAALAGRSYERSNNPQGLSFETPETRLTVFWSDPKPYGGSPRCSMNQGLWRRCSLRALAGVKEGFEVRFAGSYDAPMFQFRPEPGGTPTTLNRPMRDGQGQRWLMSGHHSFTLIEAGGFRNRLDVAVD